MTTRPGTLDITQAASAADLDAVRAPCREYRDFLLLLPSPDREIVLRADPQLADARLLDHLGQDCTPPLGSVKLARLDGAPVGCGMARRLAPRTTETPSGPPQTAPAAH